jgi:hypothetical protein
MIRQSHVTCKQRFFRDEKEKKNNAAIFILFLLYLTNFYHLFTSYQAEWQDFYEKSICGCEEDSDHSEFNMLSPEYVWRYLGKPWETSDSSAGLRAEI